MLSSLGIRRRFMAVLTLGAGMVAMWVTAEPCAAAALPVMAVVVTQKCGYPSACYCVESIPCRCHESGFCSATIEAVFDNFDYNNTQCKVLYEFPAVCAVGQSCSPPAGSSCANDDGCDPYGTPIPVYQTKYFASQASCECDPVG